MNTDSITCHFKQAPTAEEMRLFDDFMTRSAAGTFMQSSNWLGVYTPTRMQSFAYVWCTGSDGEWLMAGLARLTRIVGKLHITSFQRGPVIRDKKALEACINILCETLKKQGAFTLMLNPHCENEQATTVSGILKQHGFEAVPLKHRTVHSTTAIIDLMPEPDEILASFRGRCRHNIRTAEKRGVCVRAAQNREDALALQQVQERMAEIKGLDTAGIPDIPKLLEIIQRQGQGTLLVAELDGKIIGGIGMVKEGGRAYMQIIAISPDYADIPKTSILYWESMKIMKAQGCRTYDLVGFPEGGIEQARDKAEYGRAHFKLEFNPQIVSLLPPHVKGLRPLSHLLLFHARQRYLKSSLRRHLIPLLKRKSA